MPATKQRHTPGPWLCHDHAPFSVWSATGQAGNKQIAACRVMLHTGEEIAPHFIHSFDEAAANAHLIAAAPDLLAALKNAVQEWKIRQDVEYRRLNLPVPQDSERPEWILQAQSAIRRAEGGGL